MIFEGKYFSCYILLNHHIAFTSWDIGQYVHCNCFLTRVWRHKLIFPSDKAVFSTWSKRQDKNLNIFKTKKAFLDTHREKLALCWIQYKNSLKYKVGYFWRFHMFRQLILSSFNSIIVQMTEKCDSSNRHWKWMFASFSNFYGKIWVGFCPNVRKRFLLEFSF